MARRVRNSGGVHLLPQRRAGGLLEPSSCGPVTETVADRHSDRDGETADKKRGSGERGQAGRSGALGRRI
ncbi:MAG: hypothetical protein ACRDPW_06945 [Mycobacteriales bacterium]